MQRLEMTPPLGIFRTPPPVETRPSTLATMWQITYGFMQPSRGELERSSAGFNSGIRSGRARWEGGQCPPAAGRRPYYAGGQWRRPDATARGPTRGRRKRTMRLSRRSAIRTTTSGLRRTFLTHAATHRFGKQVKMLTVHDEPNLDLARRTRSPSDGSRIKDFACPQIADIG